MHLGTQTRPTWATLETSPTNAHTRTFTPSLSHVLAYPLLDAVKHLKTNIQNCGLKRSGLLGQIDPNTLSLKTAQYLLSEDWREYSQDLPQTGMMRNGRLYRATGLAFSNCVNGYLLLPTPTKTDAKANANKAQGYFGNGKQKSRLAIFCRDGPHDGAYPSPLITEALMTFPTSYTDLSVPGTLSYL